MGWVVGIGIVVETGIVVRVVPPVAILRDLDPEAGQRNDDDDVNQESLDADLVNGNFHDAGPN